MRVQPQVLSDSGKPKPAADAPQLADVCYIDRDAQEGPKGQPKGKVLELELPWNAGTDVSRAVPGAPCMAPNISMCHRFSKCTSFAHRPCHL